MGKNIYLINALFGIGVGAIVAIVSLILTILNFSVNRLTWFIAGIIAVAFGIYEWKKYKSEK
ncbi:MAG: hypothetical protein ABIH34_04130 [Nanoarchaeota archaeon]